MGYMGYVFWGVLIGYPLVQALAIWRSRGGWRHVAWAILATAGTAYGWCAWALFVRPRFAVHPGKLDALIEFMAISLAGPAVLLALAVVALFGHRRA